MLPVTVLHADGQVRPQPQHLHQQRELLLAVLAGPARTAFLCRLPQQHRLQDRLVDRNARLYSRLLNESEPVECLCFSLVVLYFFIFFCNQALFSFGNDANFCSSSLPDWLVWQMQTRWARSHVSSDWICMNVVQSLDWRTQWAAARHSTACGSQSGALVSTCTFSRGQAGFQPHLWECEDLKVKKNKRSSLSSQRK